MIYSALFEDTSEQEKFTRLYEAYKGDMYRVANQILGDTRDSEDVVHQAFVKILEHFHQVKEPVSPSTRAYVLIITKRTAIDLYRRRKKHTIVEWDDTCRKEAAKPPWEEANPVAAAIARLPDRYRDVIFLKYDYGLSNREIADALSLTEGNVRQLLSRAKRKLAKALEEQGVTF